MKSNLSNALNDNQGHSISVRKLISRLVSNLSQSAAVNKVFILNDVPAAFQIPSEQVKGISVIKDLLTTVVSNGRNTCISVSADKFNDIIILNFEDQNNNNGYALSFSLMAIEQQARFAGGDISIDGAQKRIATVSFSFPGTILPQNPVYIH